MDSNQTLPVSGFLCHKLNLQNRATQPLFLFLFFNFSFLLSTEAQASRHGFMVAVLCFHFLLVPFGLAWRKQCLLPKIQREPTRVLSWKLEKLVLWRPYLGGKHHYWELVQLRKTQSSATTFLQAWTSLVRYTYSVEVELHIGNLFWALLELLFVAVEVGNTSSFPLFDSTRNQ